MAWPDAAETTEMLALARQGDRAAVNQLLARHRDSLRRMIDLRLDPRLERRVDASDVVQEVLIEASRRLNDYLSAPTLPFHLWLRQMAQDRLIDAHRRHRQAARRSLDREQSLTTAPNAPDESAIQLIDQLSDRELTPATAAVRDELARRFHLALAVLDDADRELVLMRHFEQLSNQDVARTLGLTEPAASMRHLRALKRLRAALSDPQSPFGSDA